ncbi:MAG: hydantoinase B/oxoprolinase family protein [Nitrospinota bacterium]|nr:hydantoinase B/oxoprolinase family protein [Nitrospinota bacterium]
MSGFDRIQCTVIQNRLTAITRDMGTTMLRTSRSPILTEARDFITAVFDEKGRVAAQTEYIPILCASTPEAVKKTSEAFEGEIREGDLFLLNDPFCGGNHLPDLTVLKPVFSPSGRRLFWAVTKGHHADIGGAVMGGYNPRAPESITIALGIHRKSIGKA